MPDDKKNKTVKIGDRILTDEQAKVLLPTYDNIHELIQSFRREAKASDGEERSANNVISILGGRGSGKTSIMHTVRKRLESNQHDIVLPLIVPERMSSASDAMGWLLDCLENQIQILKKQYENHCRQTQQFEDEVFKMCIRKERTELEQQYFRLQTSYLFRKEQYYKRIQNKDDGMAEYIVDNREFAHSDRTFQEEFKKFIDEIVKFKRKTGDSAEEALLFIFFDDVDISAERCPEVLNLILGFLSHANIVVLVTGEYRVFSEMMTIHFLEKENIDSRHYKTSFITGMIPDADEDAREDSAIMMRKSRSQEFLKKVLPPSFRFEMSKVANKGKFFYPVVLEEGQEEHDVTLQDVMQSIVLGPNSTKLFDDSNSELLSVYYRFFDDNPRGLINPYYFLYQKRDKEWTISDIQQFMSVLIHSSWQLSDYKSVLDKTIMYEAGVTIVDYTELNRLMEGRSYTGRAETLITLQLFVDFVVRMLAGLEIEYIRRGTESKLADAFNLLNDNCDLFPEVSNAEATVLFSRVTSKLSLEDIKQLFEDETHSAKEETFYQAISCDDVATLWQILQDSYDTDPKWVKEHLENITGNSMKYSEIFYISRYNLINTFSLENLRRISAPAPAELHALIKKQVAQLRTNKATSSKEKEINLKISRYQISNRMQDVTNSLKEVEAQIDGLQQSLARINDELGGLNSGEINALISRRRAIEERIKQYQSDLDRNEPDWNNLTGQLMTASFEKDRERFENSHTTYTYDPDQLKEILELQGQQKLDFEAEPKPFVLINKSVDLNNSVRAIIASYFNAQQSIRLLRKYMPLDFKSRQDEIDQIEEQLNAVHNRKEHLLRTKEIMSSNLKMNEEDLKVARGSEKELVEEFANLVTASLSEQVRGVMPGKGKQVDDASYPELLKIFEALIEQTKEYLVKYREVSVAEAEALKAIRKKDISKSIDSLIEELVDDLNEDNLIEESAFEDYLDTLEKLVIDHNRNMPFLSSRAKEDIGLQLDILRRASTEYEEPEDDYTQEMIRRKGFKLCISKHAELYIMLKTAYELQSFGEESFYNRVRTAIDRELAKYGMFDVKPSFIRFVEKQLN
ncbi:hypothetical protein [Paenibacillus sp. MMS18-CY102]|uniref:hypothetical protein n=1 Tax=Paenibacillus sp. MMS18-CY102 TaxID=2682849 RepID=UPI0013659316|nr:hypothetical protein [Paenibacillus sp. MMS18-CY102]MWC29598.1 hypothetical protein [Paenibacillus sp. MMS18-CY102]